MTVEYRVVLANREVFLATLERLSAQRRRDSAYAWGVFEDAAEPGRFVENFLVESWLEHLRQHERVTHADRVLEERLHGLLREQPKISHLITASRAAGVETNRSKEAGELADTKTQQSDDGAV